MDNLISVTFLSYYFILNYPVLHKTLYRRTAMSFVTGGIHCNVNVFSNVEGLSEDGVLNFKFYECP
jgi:hypothetical protein